MISAILAIGFLLLWWFGKIGFGTFIVDPAMLYIGGYFVTYFIYKYAVPRLKSSAIRRFFVLLFPLTIISLWVGGLLPYLNIAESSDVYFGLLPQSFVGPCDGNGFMWNGLGIQYIFGRLVPEFLLPTYNYFWFNVLAVLIWLSFPLILAKGVLMGQATALIVKPRANCLLIHWLKIIGVGIALSFVAAALTALVVIIYQ